MRFLIIALLLSSCVTSGDLRALQVNMEKLESGAITKPEFDARNEEIISQVEARDAELAEKAGQLPTDPVSLLVYGGGLLASVLGTDKYRDAKRKKRGEPTETSITH